MGGLKALLKGLGNCALLAAGSPAAPAGAAGHPGIFRRLYDWTMSIAAQPWAPWGLFGLAFAESSFFPIPPDVVLIAMGLSCPAKVFWYAAITSAGSVLGGCLGYVIGWYGGRPLANRLFGRKKVQAVEDMYQKYDVWAVAIAGFTPIPYKVFTIATGLLKAGFWRFTAASAASRSARFFLVATLVYFFGKPARLILEKYINVALLALVALGLGGFLAVKYLARWRHGKGAPGEPPSAPGPDAAPTPGE